MAFDKTAELNEPVPHIELVFSSGHSPDGGLPMPPSAYIAMGWHTGDADGRVRLTSQEMSVETLAAQVERIKGTLDACVLDARARFTASKR